MRFRLLTPFIGLIVVLLGLARTPAQQNKADSPASEPTYDRKEVIYARKYGTAFTMDVFSPKKEANGAGVILAVSGGWFSDREFLNLDLATAILQPLLDSKYTVFAVMHGSVPKYALPEILEHMHRATRFVRQNAKEYSVNPDRLGITGISTGGHLSLMQGCTGGDGDPTAKDPVDRVSSRVQAVVAFYPVTDFLNWGQTGKVSPGVNAMPAFDFTRTNPNNGWFDRITDEAQRKEVFAKIAPTTHVASTNAPTLLIHGDLDSDVPIQQSELMLAKFKEAGVTAQLIVQKGGRHDVSVLRENSSKMVEWFDSQLRGKKAR
jgi:acetyl esterase/lipase